MQHKKRLQREQNKILETQKEIMEINKGTEDKRRYKTTSKL